MTNQTIRIKARPDEIIRFPGLCVHCAQPGATPLRLKKRHGRITRLEEYLDTRQAMVMYTG